MAKDVVAGNRTRLNGNLIKVPVLRGGVAKLVLTSRAEFRMGNFRGIRNTLPSVADSRAATFLIRHAGKIYFQSRSDGMVCEKKRAEERERGAAWAGARVCVYVRVRACACCTWRCRGCWQVAARQGQQENQRRAENDQLAWPAAAATTSGITLIRVKKRNFP